MSLDILKESDRLTVGFKETKKALHSLKLEAIYVAMDAQHKITSPLIKEAKCQGIPIFHIESMKKLGLSCNIDIGTAVAGLLKE